MVVYGWCSRDFEELVRALTERAVEQRQADENIIGQWATPVRVVVPSLDMGAYVEHVVSRVAGVAVNYDFVTLNACWIEWIEDAADGSLEVLSRAVAKTLLLQRFRDLEHYDEPWVEPADEPATVPKLPSGDEFSDELLLFSS